MKFESENRYKCLYINEDDDIEDLNIIENKLQQKHIRHITIHCIDIDLNNCNVKRYETIMSVNM